MEKVHKLIHLCWWVVLQFYSVVPDNLELSSLVFLSSTRQLQFEVVGDCYIRHSHHNGIHSPLIPHHNVVPIHKCLCQMLIVDCGILPSLIQ